MYKAFISYSREADGRLAPQLKSELRKLGKPWYKGPPFRIFLDTISMSPPVLWEAIEKALRESEYFLLLASPSSAASYWVSREIEWWLANRPLNSLVIVLTHGEIVWGDGAADFDWDLTTALPQTLRGRFVEEPLFVDLGWARAERNLSLRHSKFRAAVLDVASTLHGKPRDMLDDEDVRQSLLARRLAGAAIAGLAALSIATGVAAYVARRSQIAAEVDRQRAVEAAQETDRQRRTAVEQRRIAVEQQEIAITQRGIAVRERDLAICRQLAAEANSQLDRRLDLALLLAIEAQQSYGCAEATSSLLTALQHQPRIIRFLSGHSKHVTDLAYSVDGRRLASSGWDRTARLWDVQSGRQIGRPLDAMYGLAFTPDGKTLIASNGGESIVFWDADTQKRDHTALQGDRSLFITVELSRDGKLIAGGTEAHGMASAQVYLWDSAKREPLGPPLTGYRHAFSPDGRTLATSGDDYRSIVLWDVETRVARDRPLEGHSKNIRCLVYSPDGRKLVSGGEDNLVIVWDVATRTSHRLTGHTFPVNAVAFSHNGDVLASSGGDGKIILWDAETLQPLGAPLAATGPIFAIAFSADDLTLASTSGDDRVILWNLASDLRLGKAFQIPQSGGASNLAFSPNGRTVAFADRFHNIVLWDFDAGRQKAELTDNTTALAFNSDGTLLAAVSLNGFVSLWDLRAGQPLVSRHKLGEFRFFGARFTRDDRYLACGGDSVLLFFDVKARMAAGPPRRDQRDRIWSIAFSPDGERMAAGGNHSLWLSRRDGSRLIQLPVEPFVGIYRTDAAFSPDGNLLAYRSGERAITLWDVAVGKPVGLPLQREKGGVSALAFSPDGKMLISGGTDGTLVIWDVESRKQLGPPVPAHEDGVDALAFRHGGRALVSIGDKKLIVWDLHPENWIQTGCRTANRNLTETEWARYLPDVPYRPSCRF